MSAEWSPDDFVGLDRARLQARPGAKWQLHGPDVLSMWVADMDFPMAPMARNAVLAHLETEDMGYPSRSLAEEVAGTFAARMDDKYAWTIDPEDVRVVVDVIQAMQAVLYTCTEPGDGVTMQTPIYHPFLNTITEMDRPLVDNAWARTADSWELDIDGWRAELARNPAKALILCNPHNPTGRVMTRDELLAIGEVAIEFDLLVIADEIHAELIYDDAVHIPFASLSDELAERTVTLTAASKAFNLAGLKMAVVHSTSERINAGLDSLPGHLFGGNNTFGMKATLACWRDGQDWLDAVVAQLTTNRNLLFDLLADQIPEIVFRKPEGTYLALLDCREVDTGEVTPAEFFLEHAKVAFNEGADFGVHGIGHCRMNFATGPEIITEAVEKMAAALGR